MIGFCPNTGHAQDTHAGDQHSKSAIQHIVEGRHNNTRIGYDPREIRPTLSGHYLSSRFAQFHHDWDNAAKFTLDTLTYAPDDLTVMKRTMILSMGSGQTELAFSMARKIVEHEPDNTLALLFLAMHDLKNNDIQSTVSYLAQIENGGSSDFVMPLLNSWLAAAQGEHDVSGLNDSIIHLHHKALIANYLGETATTERHLEESLQSQEISVISLIRIAGFYAHLGNFEKAREIYERALTASPNNNQARQGVLLTTQYLQDLNEAGSRAKAPSSPLFEVPSTPTDGLSEAIFDMSRMLYSDYSDESARIFAHLSLYLNPDNVDSSMILGHIAARNNRFDDAVELYQSVHIESPQYFTAQRLSANLLEDHGRAEEALSTLKALVKSHDNIDSLMQIGDIYRRNEDFSDAIKTYNRVEQKLGGDIPAEYWQLHYVRGMSYEQLGQWKNAEDDLQAALEFQPDHPFVLNYLGYSWADQGIHLQDALDMIQRASTLRPEDGYIADSLGWVLYRMQRYEAAIPHLERAVELLPYDPVINDHLGDAYWRVGRTLEAKFQWERARNHSEDQELVATIADKVISGLPAEHKDLSIATISHASHDNAMTEDEKNLKESDNHEAEN